METLTFNKFLINKSTDISTILRDYPKLNDILKYQYLNFNTLFNDTEEGNNTMFAKFFIAFYSNFTEIEKDYQTLVNYNLNNYIKNLKTVSNTTNNNGASSTSTSKEGYTPFVAGQEYEQHSNIASNLVSGSATSSSINEIENMFYVNNVKTQKLFKYFFNDLRKSLQIYYEAKF